jgi:hypothetical protein
MPEPWKNALAGVGPTRCVSQGMRVETAVDRLGRVALNGAISEPYRIFRRLQLLRGWSHDEASSPIFP